MSFQQFTGEYIKTAADFMQNTLKHMPAEKYEWKQAPECRSAREMTEEVIGSHLALAAILKGEKPEETEISLPDIDSARKALEQHAEQFASVTESLSDSRLAEKAPVPFFLDEQWPVAHFALAQIMHTSYHMGQIAHMQRYWGDLENHFRS